MESSEDDKRKFQVGELVKFTGYGIGGPLIPPSYILGRAHQYQRKFDLGIILADANGYYKGRSFKVYWFRTRLITETFAAHLERVY
jgi:hypothetical protein